MAWRIDWLNYFFLPFLRLLRLVLERFAKEVPSDFAALADRRTNSTMRAFSRSMSAARIRPLPSELDVPTFASLA